jgi:dihydroxyacetone kinase-like protein
MVAKVGRASRLGERTLGHQDAGATSVAIILRVADEVAKGGAGSERLAVPVES